MSGKTYYQYRYHGPITVQERMVEVEYRRDVFAPSKLLALTYIRSEYMKRYKLYKDCFLNEESIKRVSDKKFNEKKILDFPRILQPMKKEA